MSTTRRSIIAAAGATLAPLEIARSTSVPAVAGADSDTDKSVADLIQRSAESNAALMRGDINNYRALITVTNDFTLMSPFGGAPTRGPEVTPERMEAMGRFFRNGTFEQEVVQTYAATDMAPIAVQPAMRPPTATAGMPRRWPATTTATPLRHPSPTRAAAAWRPMRPFRSWPPWEASRCSHC